MPRRSKWNPQEIKLQRVEIDQKEFEEKLACVANLLAKCLSQLPRSNQANPVGPTSRSKRSGTDG
jgi:hypothetical protein